MDEQHLQPGILWGQHRTSETIALGVKQTLEKDPDIVKSIPFVEFELYRLDDYIELLYREHEARAQGVTREAFLEELRTRVKPRIKEYKASLRRRFGSLLFNLHDGNKLQGLDHDLEFWIPNYISEDMRLGAFLEDVAREQGLALKLLFFHSQPDNSFRLHSPHSVIVEFMTPKPEQLMSYPSKEVERLVAEFDPSSLDNEFAYKYKVADTNSPLFQETVDNYAGYMKAVLLSLKRLNLK